MTSIAGLGTIRFACTSFLGSATTAGALCDVNDLVIVKGRVVTWDEVREHRRRTKVPQQIGAEKIIRWDCRETSGTTLASAPAGYNATLTADSHTTRTRSHLRTAVTGRTPV